MAHSFDLTVIGTGAAASTVAFRCRRAGWSVAIIDSRPFGGTCALRGCDPKKVLVGAADLLDWFHRMAGRGVRGDQVRIDWPELMRFKRFFTEPVPRRMEQGFASAGIVPFHGRARFVAPTAVRVGDDVLEARHVIVAVGAKPAPLRIPGDEHVTTSDQFLELDQLPARLVFIGGGYISFEFAHVAARAGARATILHRGPRPLVRFDPDLVDRLVQRTRDLGVEVQLDAPAQRIEGAAGSLNVVTSVGGAERVFSADMVVHGAGRVPEIDDLELDAAGVDWTARGVTVTEYLQSVSNPAVYAAGDAAASGGPRLTAVAAYEGRIVAANLLHRNHQKPDYTGVPTVVFTVPPLAAVGLHEEDALSRGVRFKKRHEDTSTWYSSRRVAERYSAFKVMTEEGDGRVLGAHLLGPHADELINLFALAIRAGLPASQLRETLYAYPTHGSDVPHML